MNSNNNLRFRRQFLFTNTDIKPENDWKRVKLSLLQMDLNLIHHSDLEYTYSKKTLTVIALGFILDPFHPGYSNQDIVNYLANKKILEEVLHQSDYYTGRYVLIVSDKTNIYVFNDAIGLRQVFYYFKNKKFWIGSSPNIIACYTTCARTESNALLEYLNSDYFKNSNSSWFGNETPYKNLYLLQPNFHLDLLQKKTTRFWPNNHLEKKNLKEFIPFVSKILIGAILSAHKRYELQLALTGGWDSRVILSASRHITKDIEFYTVKEKENFKRNIYDFTIPQKLADKFNLNYFLIELDHKEPNHEFMKIFKGNSIFNRNVYTRHYSKFIELGFNKKLDITGVVGDQILKAHYRLNGDMSAENIAYKYNLQNYKYVVNSIKNWLKETEEIRENHEIHLIDWFNWEHYCPNWAGLSSTEHDISHEDFKIFNCRELLTSFVLMNDNLRYRDYPILHKRIVHYNWKELLKVQVESSNIHYRNLKKILRFLQLEMYIEKVYKTFQYYKRKLSSHRCLTKKE